MASKVDASGDAELHRLEAALDAATERARLAKQAVKAAKAEAKQAKKNRKRARRALIEAQERAGLRDREADFAPPSSHDEDIQRPRRTTGARIADSPERRRTVQRKRTATPRRAKPSEVDNEAKIPSAFVEAQAQDVTSEPQVEEANQNETMKPAEG